MYGKLPFDKVTPQFHPYIKDTYPDLHLKNLAQRLSELRTAHDKVSTNGKVRAKLCKQELAAWLEFVEKRKGSLKDNKEFTIDEVTRIKMKDAFDRMRERTSGKVPSEKITEAHELFAAHWRFKIPIHPKNLA